MSDPAAHRDLLTPAQAARALPGGTHPATVTRWCPKGCRAADGSRVRLEHVRVGRRIYIDPAALDAFVAACTAGAERRADEQAALQPPAREPIAVRIAHQAQVVAELEAAGL